ncbi:ribose 5-phosphate isomerase B [Thermoanaerobacterium sp. DL9XJH110]|uniref:ribose 5-phosphate isomerase B n=1 Tax=Thermoanaerobacterium sp. DL9XJH110 TaxID=3386643 RepID=UPI003BB615F0
MLVALGSDHVGYDLKIQIKKYLEEKGIECRDFGAFGTDRVDYPKYALKVAKEIVSGRCEKGILFCGTGVGMAIAANKVRGIRAVVCSEPYSALLSRAHNDTNILALGSRVVGVELAKMIVDQWVNCSFEGGRHQNRIDQISKIERGEQID